MMSGCGREGEQAEKADRVDLDRFSGGLFMVLRVKKDNRGEKEPRTQKGEQMRGSVAIKAKRWRNIEKG